ncbi:MAG: cytochrome c maturation protein CcmE [Nitrospirae bacterium]|nr:cytochrome c maturation protein CcmE [Nitrospirota bacterium]
MKSKRRIFILITIMAVAFSYLLLMGMKEGSMYYLEVSEYMDKAGSLGNKKVRINGVVMKDSLEYDSKTLTLRFLLKDTKGEDTIRVVYHGSPPDLLSQEGVTAVAEGYYDSGKNAFVAKQLLVKCPSKYERKDSGV